MTASPGAARAEQGAALAENDEPGSGPLARLRARAGVPASPQDRPWRYGVAILVVLVALAARFALTGALPPTGFPFLTFFPAVIVATLYGGLGPGLLSVALSSLAAKYFFVPHLGSLSPASGQEVLALLVFTGIELLEVVAIHLMQRALARARTERARSARLAQALAEGEARLREALEAGGMGSWQMAPPTRKLVCDARLLSLWGLPPSEDAVPLAAFDALIRPEDRAARDEAMRRAVEDAAGEYRAEYRIRRADTGEERWLATRGRVAGGGAGAPRLVGVSYDITGRKQAEERHALLIREVDHRAKNALTVVQALVNLSDSTDAEGFARAVSGRVAAMARAHTLLARGSWGGASLGEVAAHEAEPYAEGGRVTIEGPPVQLVPEAVQPVAMMLHELATNAAKYGALSVPEGRVSIRWAVEPDGRLRLAWTERGGPRLDGPPARGGFGTSLLDGVAQGQLEGEVARDWRAEGLACTITIAPQFVQGAAGQGGMAAAPSAAPSLPVAPGAA